MTANRVEVGPWLSSPVLHNALQRHLDRCLYVFLNLCVDDNQIIM